jgi:hypothetical protein
MSLYRVACADNKIVDDSELMDINGIIDLLKLYEGENDTLDKILDTSTNISNNLLGLIKEIRNINTDTEKQIGLLSEIESTFEEDSSLMAINIDIEESFNNNKLEIASKEYFDIYNDNESLDKQKYSKEVHFGQGDPFEEIEAENIDLEQEDFEKGVEDDTDQIPNVTPLSQSKTPVEQLLDLYISVPNDQVQSILQNQAVPINTLAYEYQENVPNVNQDTMTILRVTVSTSDCYDLTNRTNFEKFGIANISLYEHSLIKKCSMLPSSTNPFNSYFMCLEYVIVNNKSVRGIYRIN